MQAFRCQTQIDDHGQLRLSHLPFRPGDEVEVIVLPRTNDEHPENEARQSGPIHPRSRWKTWESRYTPRSRYQASFQPPDHPVTRWFTPVNHHSTLRLQSRAFGTNQLKTSP